MPCIRLIDPSGESMLKYQWEGDVTGITTADVKKYIDDFKAGNL